MKVKRVRGDDTLCPEGGTCPTLHMSDRGTYVVQGYIVASAPHVLVGEAVVEVPLSMLPELAGAAPRDGLAVTDRGMVLVRGVQVTDAEALRDLNLPEGENAVEVPLSSLAEVRVNA